MINLLLTLVIIIIEICYVQGFQPYLPNMPTIITEQNVNYQKYNKEFLSLGDVEIFAYYQQKDNLVQPYIQASKNGKQLGQPILLGENRYYKTASGLHMIKTGLNKFVILFTICDNNVSTVFDSHYKQSIYFIEFSRFDSKLNYIQSDLILLADDSQIGYFRPRGTYVESQNKIIFAFLDDNQKQIHMNSISLGGDNKYKMEFDFNGIIYHEESVLYIDNIQIAHLDEETGFVVAFTIRPPGYNFELQFVSTRVEIMKNYQMVETELIKSQEDHRWTFHPEIIVNYNTNTFILSWWEDLSVNYKIYNFQLEQICDDIIEDSQKPSVATWGDIGLISYRNSTGNFIEEINLSNCKRNTDKLQEFYKLWGNSTVIDTQLVIQQSHFVTLQILYPENKDNSYKAISYPFEECREGCGNCDTKESCNYCEVSRTNYPACDECADGYISKSNNCFTCQELYGNQCHQCNEYQCTCEGNSENCETCVGEFRDVQKNCQCQKGFIENSTTKECDFIPCQVGFYEYNYQCHECYWVQGHEQCYKGECPIFYSEKDGDSKECVQKKSSILFLLLFIILALILICLSVYFIVKKRNEKKEYQEQQNEEPSTDSPLKKKSRLQSLDLTQNIELQSQSQQQQEEEENKDNKNNDQQQQNQNQDFQIQISQNQQQQQSIQILEISEESKNQLDQLTQNQEKIKDNDNQQSQNIIREKSVSQKFSPLKKNRYLNSNMSKTIDLNQIQNPNFNQGQSEKQLQQSKQISQNQNLQQQQKNQQQITNKIKLQNLINQN